MVFRIGKLVEALPPLTYNDSHTVCLRLGGGYALALAVPMGTLC